MAVEPLENECPPEFEPPPNEAPPEVSFRRRAAVFFGTWLIALLVTCPDPRAIGALPLFPGGILQFIKISPDEGTLALGWAVYIALGLAILNSRKREHFRFFYMILLALLLTNVVGCKTMLHSFSTIQ